MPRNPGRRAWHNAGQACGYCRVCEPRATQNRSLWLHCASPASVQEIFRCSAERPHSSVGLWPADIARGAVPPPIPPGGVSSSLPAIYSGPEGSSVKTCVREVGCVPSPATPFKGSDGGISNTPGLGVATPSRLLAFRQVYLWARLATFPL